jgi:hypothetical protein
VYLSQRYAREDKGEWLSIHQEKYIDSSAPPSAKQIEFEVSFSRLYINVPFTPTFLLQVNMHMKAGVGVSIVNRHNQEIFYISLQDINLDYGFTQHGISMEVTVQNMQVW